MNALRRPTTTTLRRKRVVVPTLAALAALGVGGTVWTATADSDLDGGERDRVAEAAVAAAGGGEAVDVETSDDAGEAYEVEVRLADGTEVDVVLDEDLGVVSRHADDEADDEGDDQGDDQGDDTEDGQGDDAVLDPTDRRAAEQAALAEVGGGTVLGVDAGDDRGEAYEVEVRDGDGIEWDVELDAAFEVLRATADR